MIKGRVMRTRLQLMVAVIAAFVSVVAASQATATNRQSVRAANVVVPNVVGHVP